MSCSLTSFGNIVDLENVKKILLGQSNQEPSDFSDDSWNWPEDGADENKSEADKERCWLENCFTALSPFGETLAIASDKKLVILCGKWDSQEEGENKLKYLVKWEGDPRGDSAERITALLCIPVAAQGRVSSSHASPDWTCVAVGFDSGNVKFFTESGCLLLCEKLHCGSVKGLHCQTLLPSTDIHDEFHIFYRSIVCTVPGIALTNTLKACRNQLARVMARMSVELEAPPLDCTKWQLTDQAVVTGASVVGFRNPTIFSHLVSASVSGGFLAHYSVVPLARHDVLASGSRPYVALHSIREGTTVPVLTDVAKAVASKLKSAFGQAVPGWLGVGRREAVADRTRERPAMDPAEPMTCRFGLADLNRKGDNLICDPHKKLAAVSDSLGRVVLIDTETSIALRMWKGYRDAQCAFIPVVEDRNVKRKALFIAIYAPKKGLIEVWPLQQGPKVATFQVSKNGRLMYLNHGLIGVSSLSQRGTNLGQFPCVFLNENGLLKQVIVPFHIILSVLNNKKAKDAHILKQIKKNIGAEGSESETPELISQLSSGESLKQALDIAVRFKHTTPSLLKMFITAITEKLHSTDVEGNSVTEKECLNSCSNLEKLLVIYEFLTNLRDMPPDYISVVPTTPDEDHMGICGMLRVTEKEIESLVLNLKLVEGSSKAKVTFQDSSNLLPSLLSCFRGTYSDRLPLFVDKSSDQTHCLGNLLCQCVLYGTCSIDKWRTVIDDFILPKDLLFVIMVYWLSKPHCQNIISEIMNFTALVTTVCSLADPKEITLWWPDLRTIISNTENTAAALSAVYVLRSISVNDEDRLFDKGDGDWVTVSQESCLWSQTIAQLEAIILLQSAISYKAKDKNSDSVPCLEVSMPSLSLTKFLAHGPGLVSEVVAQWVGSWGLAVEWVCDAGLTYRQEDVSPGTSKMGVVEGCLENAPPARPAVPSTPPQERVITLLGDLISKFPHTLTVDSLVANLAWEYSLAWTKNKTNVRLLDYALRALSSLSNIKLQHGLCCVMWSAHLCVGFESTVRLLHKIGKLPKERLCVQEIGIPDSSIHSLLSFYSSFFELFIQSCAENVCDVQFGVEELWTWGEVKPSLVQLAITRSCDNVPLLKVKYQCATALHLLTRFGVRIHRPLTALFDSVGEVLLMNDVLNQSKLPPENFSVKLKDARIDFLKKIISAIVEGFPMPCQNEELNEAMEWFGRSFRLADDWELPSEPLRHHQTSILYLFGHDYLAEQVVTAINDKETLGTELLTIAGQRMKTILSTSTRSEIKETMATLSPSVTNWIQQLECVKLGAEISSVKRMTVVILNLLPSESADYKIASLLFEAMESL